MAITKQEFKSRLGYIMLGFFTFYLVDPIQAWVNSNWTVNPFVIGIGGILLTLWIFDF